MSDAARERVEKKSTVTPRVGRYVGNQGALALVDLGDQRIPVQFASWGVPQINESVWVDSIDGVLRLTGPTTPKPGIGVILTITGTAAVVRTDFGDYTMAVAPTDPMPTSGDTVGISWSSQPWCTLLVDLPDPEPPAPEPGGGGAEVKSLIFRATDTGSTDRPPKPARWWKSNPTAWNSTIGAWFYGNQLKDTIPADAEFVSLEFYIAYVKRAGAAPRFVLHDAGSKGPIPGLSPYVEWAPGGGFQTPPDPLSWFNALKAGGPYAGIGLNQGGDNVFSDLVQDGMSGALRISWR